MNTNQTSEEIDAALAAAAVSAPAPVRAALASSVGVTLADLQRRMQGSLERAEQTARHDRERSLALEAKRLATRASIECRPLDPKLIGAVKAHATPCALLLGPTGCGKTSAAHWITAGQACHLVRSRDLATASRRHGLGDGYPPEVARARERVLCVIDDVGSEGGDVATLQDILDVRYSRGYPTIVTTGLTDEGLRAHLGAAHYRRIVDQHVLRPDGREYPVLVVDCHAAGA